MRSFLILFSVLFLFACKEDAPEQNSEAPIDSVQEVVVAKVTKKDIEALVYTDYGLSSTTIKNVKNWVSYGELESHILAIKNGNLSFFEGDEKVIAALIKDLRSTIPKTVSSESILARITALETKLYKLRSAVLIPQTPKAQLLQNIKEFFVTFSNLNLQMNKKFEKEAQNITKFDL